MVSHPEQAILESEVKWPLGDKAVTKASGCDRIPVQLSKTLKDDAIKVLHSICQHIWKTRQWPQDWKRSILIPIPKKGITKECANHQTTILISHASKVMLEILHARLHHYVNQDLPDVQAEFRKGRGNRDQTANRGLNLRLMHCRWTLYPCATWEALRNSPCSTEAESRTYWVKFKAEANYKRSVDPFRAN